VGEQTRFRRILLGRDVPELHVAYASVRLLDAVRHAALALAFGAALYALGRGRRAPRAWIVAGAALALLLFAAHYVPGVHRRILWGIDVALLLALARARGPSLRRAARVALRAPWHVVQALTLRRLLAAIGACWLLGVIASHPPLLPLAALFVLSIAWARCAPARAAREVRHAR
jgi:hypothetical protein